jgi:hypothetical protein
MALQTLHAITIDDLAFSNPGLHAQYLNLVNHLIEFIRELVKSNNTLSQSSSLSEKYDTNSNEAYLELVISDGKERFISLIYIHQTKNLLVTLNDTRKSATTAEHALNIIKRETNWIK